MRFSPGWSRERPPSPLLVTRRLTVGRRDCGEERPDRGNRLTGQWPPFAGGRERPVKDGETSEEKKRRGNATMPTACVRHSCEIKQLGGRGGLLSHAF